MAGLDLMAKSLSLCTEIIFGGFIDFGSPKPRYRQFEDIKSGSTGQSGQPFGRPTKAGQDASHINNAMLEQDLYDNDRGGI